MKNCYDIKAEREEFNEVNWYGFITLENVTDSVQNCRVLTKKTDRAQLNVVYIASVDCYPKADQKLQEFTQMSSDIIERVQDLFQDSGSICFDALSCVI